MDLLSRADGNISKMALESDEHASTTEPVQMAVTHLT